MLNFSFRLLSAKGRILACSALAVSICLPACTQRQVVRPEVPDLAAKQDSGSAVESYEIGPEDVLDISVWKEEGLKREILVRPDGFISFPLVGELRAAGRTVKQLQKEIVARLQRYIPDPVVTVGVLKINSNKIYVMGKVNKPGEYLTGRYVDVLQVLSMAGGLTPFAAENDIKIIRKVGRKTTVLPFEYAKVRAGAALHENIQLQAGDTVVVP